MPEGREKERERERGRWRGREACTVPRIDFFKNLFARGNWSL
jgi:hypothetical protein